MKKKLKFSELSVQSFVTSLTNKENAHLVGASEPLCKVIDSVAYLCYAPTANPQGCADTQRPQDSICYICYKPTLQEATCVTTILTVVCQTVPELICVG